MGLTKEDWERVHFNDQMYLREKEWEEQEHYYNQQKPAIVMGDVEVNTCVFCNKEKPVTRTYLYPSRYRKPSNVKERLALHNEGDYFHYIYSCIDCGEPVKHKNLIK